MLALVPTRSAFIARSSTRGGILSGSFQEFHLHAKDTPYERVLQGVYVCFTIDTSDTLERRHTPPFSGFFNALYITKYILPHHIIKMSFHLLYIKTVKTLNQPSYLCLSHGLLLDFETLFPEGFTPGMH
jgi:hypothetical protein